jgi:hypothetical protein
MKKLSRFSAVAVAVLICVNLPNAAAQAEAWSVTGQGSPDGTMVAAITEGADYAGVSRRIINYRDSAGVPVEYLCLEGPTAEGDCSLQEPGSIFYSSSVLPFCASNAQTDCVETLLYGTTDSDLKKASFVREIAGQTYPAIPENGGAPAGGTISIFEAPGLPNSAGTIKYAVQVNAETGFDAISQRYQTFGLSASIIPISDKTGPGYITPKLHAVKAGGGTGKGGIGGWGFTPGCALTEANYCGVTEDFAPNSRFSLSIRASNQITGWFKGRIQKPNVSIEKFSATNNRITMAAEPVAVPRLAALVTPENTSAAGISLLSRSMRSGAIEMFKGNTLRNTRPDMWDSIAWVEEFRKAAKDTAAGVSTLWAFATLSGGQENNDCFDDKTRVVGVVTTNATALAIGAPEFSNNMLDYKVAGLHYAPDGKTLNEGTYDLVMRSDVARCLYGFTNAPISAKISVVGEGGENKVATTVVSEKDGWLKMAAYGFTFSSPTISVKLSQAKAPAKKTTITCVKGKLTKKVTAVGPKCPAGYKKK